MTNKRTIAIFAHANLQKELLKDVTGDEYVIGVDRGAYWLIKQGIIPDIGIGDFDSCTQAEIKEIKSKVKDVLEYPSEKDKTDLELAVDHAIALHPKQVIIYGGTGKRLDHEFASVFLLKRLLDERIEGILKDVRNEVWLVQSRIEIPRSSHFTFVSLIPFTKNIVVTLKGFKYNVQRKTIIQGETTGVSNEIKDEVGTIEIHEGIAYIILSRD